MSCLTSSTKECRPVPLAGQVESLKRFRDPNLDFANHQPAAVKLGSLAPPSAVLPRPARSARRTNTLEAGNWKVEAASGANPGREKPRGSVGRSFHPLGVLKPKPACAGSSIRSPRATDSDPDLSPYRRSALHRTEARFRSLTLTEPKPGQSARPFRSGNPPLPGRPSHDRSFRTRRLSRPLPLYRSII